MRQGATDCEALSANTREGSWHMECTIVYHFEVQATHVGIVKLTEVHWFAGRSVRCPAEAGETSIVENPILDSLDLRSGGQNVL
jgi:hypothetical protein